MGCSKAELWLSRRERGIVWQVAAKMPSQKPSLQQRQQANWDFLVEQRMRQFFPFALHQSRQYRAPRCAAHQHRAAWLRLEAVRLDLFQIDQANDQPIRDD